NDPVNISNHVLIVYNSGTQTSTNLKHYYTGKRPHFSGANVLPLLNCPSGETISYSHFVTGIKNPIIDYLTAISGSKPIRYIVMMQDIPTRVIDTNKSSVSTQLYTAFKDNGLR